MACCSYGSNSCSSGYTSCSSGGGGGDGGVLTIAVFFRLPLGSPRPLLAGGVSSVVAAMIGFVATGISCAAG